MSRPQQQAIRLGAESLEGRIQLARPCFHRSAYARRPLQQITTPHIAGKNEVAGESSHRLRRGGLIDEQEGQMLRGVPRRVLHVQADVSGADVFTIAAADTLMKTPSRDLMVTHFPETQVADQLGEFETLLSIEKARRVLGYAPRHGWRT